MPEALNPEGSAPEPIDPTTGQHGSHWVLPKEERTKGFIRPVRSSYTHDLCGTVTTMGSAIAETYARSPKYYGQTFCSHCKIYDFVGEHGVFTWLDGEKVGT